MTDTLIEKDNYPEAIMKRVDTPTIRDILDNLLKDLGFYKDAMVKSEQQAYDQAETALNAYILGEVMELTKDVPIDQPFDEEMDTITLNAHQIFRKAVNWQNQELRNKANKKFGVQK